MDSPYAQPRADEPESAAAIAVHNEHLMRKRRFWRRSIWISGLGIVIPPMFGLLGTAIGMMRAFTTLREASEADPERLASDVSLALNTTLWGLCLSTLAFIYLLASLVRFLMLPKPVGVPADEGGSAPESTQC